MEILFSCREKSLGIFHRIFGTRNHLGILRDVDNMKDESSDQFWGLYFQPQVYKAQKDQFYI